MVSYHSLLGLLSMNQVCVFMRLVTTQSNKGGTATDVTVTAVVVVVTPKIVGEKTYQEQTKIHTESDLVHFSVDRNGPVGVVKAENGHFNSVHCQASLSIFKANLARILVAHEDHGCLLVKANFTWNSVDLYCAYGLGIDGDDGLQNCGRLRWMRHYWSRRLWWWRQ